MWPYPYRFILVYQDHLTKFTILEALQTKSAQEVALKLYNIFSLMSAPLILQSDNGQEFVNKVNYSDRVWGSTPPNGTELIWRELIWLNYAYLTLYRVKRLEKILGVIAGPNPNYKAEEQNLRKRIESRGIKNLTGFKGFTSDYRS